MRFREREVFFFKQKFINIEVCKKDDKSFPIKTDLERVRVLVSDSFMQTIICVIVLRVVLHLKLRRLF